MNPMMHRNYAARIKYSNEDACFIGRVDGIKPIITFHGDSVDEIRQAFQEAVDFYIETCSAKGEKPEKPFSCKIWKDKNQEAIEKYNAKIAKYGLFSDGLRQF